MAIFIRSPARLTPRRTRVPRPAPWLIPLAALLTVAACRDRGVFGPFCDQTILVGLAGGHSTTLTVGEAVPVVATQSQQTQGVGGVTCKPTPLDPASMGWESSDTTVATIGADGIVHARAPGAATITGHRDRQTPTLDLTVVP